MIKWKKVPGGIAKIGITGGACMVSEDGRFAIYVRRYLQGNPGNRSYAYHYQAVDYGIGSNNKTGGVNTTITFMQGGMKREYSYNKDTVLKAAETWAASHPRV